MIKMKMTEVRTDDASPPQSALVEPKIAGKERILTKMQAIQVKAMKKTKCL